MSQPVETDPNRPSAPLTRTVQWLCMTSVIASALIILATIPCLIAQWHSSPYGSMRARFYLLMFVFAMVIADTLNNFWLSFAMLMDWPVSMRNYYLARVATYVPIDGPLMLALLHRTVGLLLSHRPELRRGILLGGIAGAVMLTTMSATAIISETIRTYRKEQEQGSDAPWAHFAVPSYGVLSLLPYPFVVIYASWWALAKAFPREQVARRRMNLGLAGLADGKLSSHHHQQPFGGCGSAGHPHDSYAMGSIHFPPAPLPAGHDHHSPLPISPPPQYNFTDPPSPGSFNSSPELPKRPLSASFATRRPDLRLNIPPPLPRPHLAPGILTPDSPQPSPITPCTPLRESRPLVTFAPSPTQLSPSTTFTPPRPTSAGPISPAPSPRALTGPSAHASFHFNLHSMVNPTNNKRASAATSLFSLAPAPAIKRPLVRTFQWLTVLVVILWILGGSVLLIDRSVLNPRLRSILASTVSAASVLLEAAFVRVFKVQCRIAMQPAANAPGLRARIVKWFQGSSGENRDETRRGGSEEAWSSYYVGGGGAGASGVVSGTTQNAPVYWIDHEDLAKMHAARVAAAARPGAGAGAAAAPGAQTFSQLWRAQANTWRVQMCHDGSRQESHG